MRRTYAFESDCPENVKGELEKVEAAVDEKCASAEDCDKVLAKIDDQAEKFDDALKSMANAAKDAKAGGDQAAATASIKEAQADLKQVAKTIGVANESDSEYADRTEIEDAKAYLEGAREIVEAKKDELSDGGCEGGECDDDANEACEAWLDAYSDALADALESEIYDGIAMEGATSDGAAIFWSKHKELNAMKKEMNAAAKSGDYKTAAAKARECANIGGEMESAINSLPQDMKGTVLVKIAMAVAAALASAAAGAIVGGRKGAKAYKNSRDGQWAAEKLADAKELHKANGQNKRNVKGFAKELRQGTITGAAKGAAKPAAIGGGGAALVAGAAAGASFLRKKKVVDEEGNTHSERLQPNEYNTVLNLIKADAKRIKAAFTKKAEAFEAKASEAPAVDATESFISTMESLMINGSEPNEESEAVQAVESWVAACESELSGLDDDEIDLATESMTREIAADGYDMAMEGANIQGIKAYDAGIKKAKEIKKEMKAAAKAKDWDTAIAKAREGASACDEIKRSLSEIPTNAGSNVFAHIAGALAAIATGMITSAAVGAAAGFTGMPLGNKGAIANLDSAAAASVSMAGRNAKAMADAKKAKKEAAANTPEGEAAPSTKLNANERNQLLNHLRHYCDKAKDNFLNAAKIYEKKKAKGGSDEGEGGGEPAAESWLLA